MMNYGTLIDVSRLTFDILFHMNIKWTVDGTGVLMANGQSEPISAQVQKYCWPAIREIESLYGSKAIHAMVNRVPPKTFVPIHVDAVKDNPVRFHLPLITSKHCYFWNEEDGMFAMGLGFWHKFNYSIPHALGNFGFEERIHLIVDLK
jgi:hypothetical protein